MSRCNHPPCKSEARKMFCESPQPDGEISLTLDCGVDCASMAGHELRRIEGGVEMRTPWAFDPGAIIAVGLQCNGCDKCLRPVEMLVAECRESPEAQSGYLTTLLFLEAIDLECEAPESERSPILPS